MTTLEGTADNSHCQPHDLFRPSLFNPTNPRERDALAHLRSTLPETLIHDRILGQLVELVEVRSPSETLQPDTLRERARAHLADTRAEEYGIWVHYPWSQRLVHVLPEAEFEEVRLSRNRNKITVDEQRRLAALRIGIVGLSVGQASAITLAMEGVGGHFVLADFDALSLSNMNRLRAGVHDIGTNKAVLTARQLFEINPYARVSLFPEGLTDANVDVFLCGQRRLDLLIEECDDMYMKVRLRELARQQGIPVLMETSDRGMLDVERFDLEPDRALFHGRVPGLEAEHLRALEPAAKLALGMAIVGAESVSPRLAASAVEIGSTIRTWPQLASAVSLGAAVIADTARRIALGEFTGSGRYYIDLERLVAPVGSTPTPATSHPMPRPTAAPAPARAKPPGEDIALVRHIVECAAAAPSGGNAQPWRFHWNGSRLRCSRDTSRSGSLLDYEYRATHLAFGAAAENIALAAAHAGLTARVLPFPADADRTVVCDVELRREPECFAPDPLYRQIFQRCTNRRLGRPVPLLAGAAARLQQAAGIGSATLRLIDAPAELQRLGEILGRGDRIRFLSRRLHQELVSELRWSVQEAELTRDGIDLRTLELGSGDLAALKLTSAWRVMELVGSVGGGRNLEKFAHRAAAGSSAFGVLTIPGATPRAFFEGGRAMQRVWLAATELNLGFQPMTALPYLFMRAQDDAPGLTGPEHLALNQLSAEYHVLTRIPDGHSTLMLFRLALVPEPSARALRRPVDDVLFISHKEHSYDADARP